jgi:hypothetical protein
LVPTRNGSVAEAPGGGHITQCGATLNTAGVEAVVEDLPVPVAAVLRDDAGAGVDDGVVALVVVDVVVVDVVAEEGVAVVFAGKLTAPDDLAASVLPAMPGPAGAVWAAAGPTSAISSGRATRTKRNGWAITPPDANLRSFYAAPRA